MELSLKFPADDVDGLFLFLSSEGEEVARSRGPSESALLAAAFEESALEVSLTSVFPFCVLTLLFSFDC